MKKIVVMVNRDFVLYNFRLELVERLLALGEEVYISLPFGPLVEDMKQLGCKFIDTPIDKRGTNPFRDGRLLLRYIRLLQSIRPDYVLTYTIKPNIYGAIAAGILKIPFLVNISGLGTAVEFQGILQKLTLFLYRAALKKADVVFFQNRENMDFFLERKITEIKKAILLPGSGVNLKKFQPLPYPEETSVSFLFIGRVIREKGIEEYIEAARRIRKQYPHTLFHVLGPCDGDYQALLELETERKTIIWHGMVKDVRKFLKESHCTIHPSYYPEGMSNALLESAASARPVITTGRSGCRETVEDGVTGYLFEMKNPEDLCRKIERFLKLSHEEKRKMGQEGRKKMEEEFNRDIVVEAYLNRMKG